MLTSSDASCEIASQLIQQINQQLRTGARNIRSLKGESEDILLGGLNKVDASKTIAKEYVEIIKVFFLSCVDDKLLM